MSPPRKTTKPQTASEGARSAPASDSAPRRRRLDAESARRAILGAAAERLKRSGPDGLRLKPIAADLGISHSSILHHFGSRDGLLDALAQDAFESLTRDLRATLEAGGGPETAPDLIERISQTLDEGGHARLLVWQLTSRPRTQEDADTADDDSGKLLERIAEVVHQNLRERAERRGAVGPDLDETRRFVTLMACLLFGEALAGELFATSAGLDPSQAGRQAFRVWLARQGERILFPTPSGDSDRP